MKSNVILPAATALIGFSLAWIAKPGVTMVSAPVASKTEESTAARPPRTETNPKTPTNVGKRPVEVKAGDFPLAEQAEKGPKTGEEAKMLRLTEALGLSIDQQGSVIQLISDSQAAVNLDVSAIEDLTTRGKAIEAGLQKILTPEQFAKFQEIQERERDNRNEFRAQRMLTEAIEYIDLSPEQREEIASRLRQKSKSDLQSIPAAATLLFSKSILPTGGKEMTPEGVLLLNQMGEKITMGNPEEIQKNLMNRQKQELEETLKCFDGILTPGQMGQYQAAIIEKRETMKRLQDQVNQGKLAARPSLLEPGE
ncbi:MAG: hypothetical protein ABIS50_08120 [Luteolibacter sp.]|uniref:hypothetical protein n=1 Tax=Luteolibacter sp. TaxID=1962973 RepID=UPI00326757E6